MSEEDVKSKSLVPYVAIAVVLIVLIGAVLFWPADKPIEPVPPVDVPVTTIPEVEPLPMPEEEPMEEEPEVMPEPEVEPELIPEPEPVDTSDGAVKTELLKLSDYGELARLLVNDDLLQRFVITTNNLADEELPANHQVLAKPDQTFRTFQQADKEWIDPASYKRYTPYVDVLESLDPESLEQLYQEYKPAINQIFAEISSPGQDFDETLIDAIDLLLDTPEVPVPVEVYTDSVMFKFKDQRLEALAAPQKQLLRTGPENMRRIKAKLRELRTAIAADQE
ncbi:DUF3014 domain-containing protein [Paraglaciecola chathamensis]|uniref:DUF3014 domain-containing protein n=1 Tax=Paraglaciecola chathamensis TaxID=368405 RepID=UPI002703EA9C|nr:DUF3014 domain-containing protein [Paraglaciecola chathamensis]MDO6561131.1 DUF3014 domain-containing protein [Paraglaciecola chathamensis]